MCTPKLVLTYPRTLDPSSFVSVVVDVVVVVVVVAVAFVDVVGIDCSEIPTRTEASIREGWGMRRVYVGDRFVEHLMWEWALFYPT